MFKKSNIFILLPIMLICFSGCTTTREHLEQARFTISELEQINGERATRNAELEQLYNIEREGNQALKRIIEGQRTRINNYLESERKRIEEEKRIIDSLTGIFGEGNGIIRELREGYYKIREIVLQPEEVE
ncbi:MAG: hypothetical protein GY804_04195 [Alphaproteobacteria bacterium]|nr:hypothetical protein [Alphaproteobacteria bacterium]